MECPFFPGGLFYAAWFPQPKFYRLHGRPVRRRCARPVSFRMRMHMHSPLRRCAREERFLLRRILRGGSRAAHLVLCAHFLAEGRSPERGKPGSIFRTGTAFSARSGCSKAASARERIMLSSAARAAGRSCASRAARERSASPARAAGTPLKRRPEEDAPPSVKIRPKPFKRLKELAVCKLQAASSFACPKPAMADRIASRKESEKPGSPRVLAGVGCFFYPLHRLVFCLP